MIHLAIGIHGIPVDRDSLFYNELRATALQAYYTYGIEDRDKYYYSRVFVGVLRASDFIFSLPQFEGTNYVVQGGMRYYDVINFARLVKVPGFYTWGFNDNTVPPTSSFVTYDTVSAPKEKMLFPETGHNVVPPQRAALDEFLFKALGIGNP